MNIKAIIERQIDPNFKAFTFDEILNRKGIYIPYYTDVGINNSELNSRIIILPSSHEDGEAVRIFVNQDGYISPLVILSDELSSESKWVRYRFIETNEDVLITITQKKNLNSY